MAAKKPAKTPGTGPSIGLALGSGGARGFAHLVFLEAFDELGLMPAKIAGTSMGAVLGAAYAAGMPARDIKDLVEDIYASSDGKLFGFIMRREFLKYAELIDPAISQRGLMRGAKFLNFLLGKLKAEKFSDLKIPLIAVATDFWAHKPKAFSTGSLLPALKASMAAPFVFTPEEIDGVTYVDGALTNPVPWDEVADDVDITVAVNVMEDFAEGQSRVPTFADIVAEYQDGLTMSLIAERAKRIPPDIYVAPRLRGLSSFDFFKVREVYNQTLPLKDKFKDDLSKAIDRAADLSPGETLKRKVIRIGRSARSRTFGQRARSALKD